ncbi:bifunctional (p)ppGpp synthetase/guanosine-3',5'-bis(diphosphate) 3'-pyrophosphohydrolase [Candidatus Peregrinibacteria bacterium]|nr:bifunctional (p)ppGpp synthetase/guanosine-3',5'-bis(diphosphate) 3'-pyrophosphohydrolase [Candidatus Peregrinibacteria bacterium]
MAKTASIGDIIKGAKKYLPHLNEERVMAAYEFAKKAHEGQTRASGRPYIEHPLNVAAILLELKPDEDSLIVTLLHDVLEDTQVPAEELLERFGESILPLLKGMEKLGTVYYRGQERQVENLRKMFLAMAADIRVILIKLADRLHNMRTLEFLPEEKRRRIAEETLTIYCPIAGRLGIYWIKNELEDLGFKYLFPDDYERMTQEMKEATGVQKNIIKKGTAILVKTLKQAKIPAQVEGRVKHLYSIHRKLKRKGKNYINELYDVFALRVVVEDAAMCYQTLGVLHHHWTPLSHRFKDYIGHPKPNGYQSLHTTLIGLVPKLHNQPIEVQIRSKEMDAVAKFGIAAHWQYKEESGRSIAVPDDKLNWVQSLVQLHESLKNNAEFIESLNLDAFHDRIFTLTPQGDVFDLPKGATPVDFAYAVHSDVGNSCKGTKVNGQIVPLDYKLQNGEVVEILSSNAAQPNRYWLSFVVTSHAKNRIKQWFNAQDSDKLLKLGKELINSYLKRFGQPPLDPNLSLLKNHLGKKLSIRERQQLIEKIGNGSVDVMNVIKDVLPAEKVMKKPTQAALAREVLTEGVKLEKSDVLITGEKGYQTQIASCCMPKPNEPIIGYITRGKGVTIHSRKCKTLRGLEPERFIKASWSTEKQAEYEVKLLLTRQSRIGMLRDIADVFTSAQLPILDIKNIRHEGTDVGEMEIIASVDSVETLNRIIEKLEAVPGIFSVKEIS